MRNPSPELMEDYAIEEFLVACRWAAEKGEPMTSKKKTAKKTSTKKSSKKTSKK